MCRKGSKEKIQVGICKKWFARKIIWSGRHEMPVSIHERLFRRFCGWFKWRCCTVFVETFEDVIEQCVRLTPLCHMCSHFWNASQQNHISCSIESVPPSPSCVSSSYVSWWWRCGGRRYRRISCWGRRAPGCRQWRSLLGKFGNFNNFFFFTARYVIFFYQCILRAS